jgi:hypothetical protein
MGLQQTLPTHSRFTLRAPSCNHRPSWYTAIAGALYNHRPSWYTAIAGAFFNHRGVDSDDAVVCSSNWCPPSWAAMPLARASPHVWQNHALCLQLLCLSAWTASRDFGGMHVITCPCLRKARQEHAVSLRSAPARSTAAGATAHSGGVLHRLGQVADGTTQLGAQAATRARFGCACAARAAALAGL